MKTLDLNILLPERKDIFDEESFKRERPDLYEKYLIPSSQKSDLKIVIETIANMIERGVNKMDLKTGRATQAVNMDVQYKYGKVMNIIEGSEDNEGIAEFDDDDFRFLNRKFHQGEAPLIRDFNKILIPVSRAIKKADIDEAKPEDKKKKIEK